MKKRAFIYIIAAGILWGTSGIFVKSLSPYGYTSLDLTALRGIISFIFFLTYAAIRERSAFKVTAKQLLYFLGIGLTLFGTAGFYFLSLEATSISTAVVLMYTAPVYVTVFSAIFLGEKFSKPKIAAVVMMFLGCCFVSGIIGGMKFDFLGILFGIIAGLSFASYNILTKICMQKSFSPISANLYGSAFMTAIALVFSNPAQVVTSTKEKPLVLLPALVALGVVTFVLPYLFYALGMKELHAGTASTLSTVEPLSASVFGIVLFNESLTVFSVIGMSLILFAVTLLGLSENRCTHTNKSSKGETKCIE